MAETTYSYAISADFPSGKVDGGSLVEDIRSSAIVTAVERVDTSGDSCDVVFKDALSAGDKTILDNDATGPSGGLIGAHLGVAVTSLTEVHVTASQTDVFGHVAVSSQIAEGNGLRVISHNFCDACSWWHGSTEHTAQASTTGDDLMFDLTGHTNVIDLRHKRVTFEDNIDGTTVAPNGVTMTNVIPTVTLDTGGGPVALAQSNEDAASGDDRYTIDYPAGTVTFAVARAGSDVVTADFRKSASSVFCFKPSTGKKWIIEDAEIDMSEDIDMTATVMTDTFGSHSTLTGGAIVSVQVKKYKTFHDFQAAARKFWGPVPVNFGGTGGVNSQKWTFQWEYSRADHVYNSANYLDLNVDPARLTPNREESSVEGDVELGGSFMTITIYGKEASESDGGG